jgi:hypothetical protein
MHLHRRGVGPHAFDVNGCVCLAAAYLEPDGEGYRYRYAVLCGSEAAERALRTAVLDPGDSDGPSSGRRVALATYGDHEDFNRASPHLPCGCHAVLGRTAGASSRSRRTGPTGSAPTVGSCEALLRSAQSSSTPAQSYVDRTARRRVAEGAALTAE